jgi:hypothetical protein
VICRDSEVGERIGERDIILVIGEEADKSAGRRRLARKLGDLSAVYKKSSFGARNLHLNFVFAAGILIHKVQVNIFAFGSCDDLYRGEFSMYRLIMKLPWLVISAQ